MRSTSYFDNTTTHAPVSLRDLSGMRNGHSHLEGRHWKRRIAEALITFLGVSRAVVNER